jgi:hypothetical protein
MPTGRIAALGLLIRGSAPARGALPGDALTLVLWLPDGYAEPRLKKKGWLLAIRDWKRLQPTYSERSQDIYEVLKARILALKQNRAPIRLHITVFSLDTASATGVWCARLGATAPLTWQDWAIRLSVALPPATPWPVLNRFPLRMHTHSKCTP